MLLSTRKQGRDGQIQFGESLMVVIVLVFIMVLGIVFYYNIAKKGLVDEFRYREDVEAVKLAKNVLTLPEVACDTFAGGDGCVDQYKLEALATLLAGGDDSPAMKGYYGELFGYATIKVHYVTGDHAETTILLYNDTPTRNYTVTPQFIFTTLYDPVSRTHVFAYLNVSSYHIEVTA